MPNVPYKNGKDIRLQFCPHCEKTVEIVYDYSNKDIMLSCDHILKHRDNVIGQIDTKSN